jgi:CO/xanthine dehydrogenase Mo-binding subunit
VGPSPAYSYSAAVVEVDVDVETGIYTVPKVWIAHDIGKSINPVLVLGQVEGSVYMGLGEAMMEEMAYRGNANENVVHKFPSILEYKSPTTKEMSEVETFLIENPDPNGPFGAKEVGQGPLLPIPPAVVNAIYDAVGVRIDEIPATPEKVFQALKLKKEGKPARVGPSHFPDVPYPSPSYIATPAEGGDGKAAEAAAVGAGGVR